MKKSRTKQGQQFKKKMSILANSSVAACSVIARNYLSYANVLSQSYYQHHPNGRFYLLIVDLLPSGTYVDDRIHLIQPTDLSLPGFYEMCFKYDITELATAVKPWFMWHILENYDEEAIVYLDPDILIMNPFKELGRTLAVGDIVLTPHLLAPIPMDE